MRTHTLARSLVAVVALSLACLAYGRAAERGFTDLFNGRDLTGWKLMHPTGSGYVVRDGILVCPADGGGNLFTEKEYGDFIFRFEFRLQKGSNNGLGIRAPLEGDAAYAGMELQILDNPSYQGQIEPWQRHGSIYGVVAARDGALKPAGEWNSEEVVAVGRRIQVRLNGKTIVDANLDDITDPAVLVSHPGLLREKGHIGFLGHGSQVEFRKIRIRDLSGTRKPTERPNVPPKGFQALFNGRDLTGWKGLVESPPKRAAMSRAMLAKAQEAADRQMRDHWKVIDGDLVYDGKGNSLCTAKDYRNFDLLVDWKIPPGGDSGIYLRGSPQVQIWDDPVGSGGLYNNEKNPSKPLVKADRAPGEWNRFRIIMLDDKVTVWLNGQLVTHNVTMENYWERDKPIYPTGQIELQHHESALGFRNVFIRELPD